MKTKRELALIRHAIARYKRDTRIIIGYFKQGQPLGYGAQIMNVSIAQKENLDKLNGSTRDDGSLIFNFLFNQ